MLKPEVIEAVEAGKFNVWAVDHVDKALEILTGVTAGKRRQDGSYPPNSIHGLVAARLAEMAEKIKGSGENNSGQKSKAEEPPSCDSCGK